MPLIDRAKFFGNPSQAGRRISPDGRWHSWVAPRDGVLNLWVAPLDKPEQARTMTNERQRPIRQSFWLPGSKTSLCVNDQGGDENLRLDGVDVASGALKSYATLAGLAFTPKEFARGVDIVSPSNLFRLLGTIPPYWEAFKKPLYRRMGDPTTPEGQALLKEHSPLNFAANIELRCGRTECV